MSSQYPRSFNGSDAEEAVDLGPLVNLASRVADAVPSGSPDGWRRVTFRAVLSAVIRDRVENETGNLEDGDVESLSEFVAAAVGGAATAPEAYRDDAYEILLQALLEDWVDNWEGTDDDDDDD
ncbi:MAG TPA: hypothetical protein VOB72_17740 [Candidatus Dormibacteraeota bacterium]|nr:hypothetical protein [Candidatus Dormibacteraeota bacterium]